MAEARASAAGNDPAEAAPTDRDAVGAALARVLDVGDDAQRCFAAGSLGRLDWPGSRDPLVAALRDPDEDVRLEAAEALGRFGDRGAAPALLDSLRHDPSGEVKRAVVAALARLGTAEAVPLLRALAAGRGEDAGILWEQPEAGGWDDWLDVQVEAIEALARLGDTGAVGAIEAALADEEGQSLGAVATGAFSRLGEDGAAALGRCLARGDRRGRRQAAAGLARMTDDASAALLRDCLDDPDAQVRLCAVSRLGALEPQHRAVQACFADPDEAVRAEACRRVAPSPEVVARRLADPAAPVRLAMLRRLPTLDRRQYPDDLVKRLLRAIGDGDVEVAATAAETLRRLAPETALVEFCARLTWAGASGRERAVAARALGGLAGAADRSVVETLAGCVGDTQREVRLAAMSSLAALAAGDGAAGTAAQTVLLSALAGRLVPAPESGDETPAPAAETEASAAEIEAPATAAPTSTLGAILGEEAAIGAAQAAPAGHDLSAEDLLRLEQAAGRRTRKRVPVEPLVPPHLDVRRFAARLAGDLRGAAVVPALLELLRDEDRELRDNAADSLARCLAGGAPAPDHTPMRLRVALASGAPPQRRALARAVAALDRPAARKLLKDLLEDADPHLRRIALDGLLAGEEGAESAAAMIDDTDGAIRLVAAEALARRGGSEALGALTGLLFGHDGLHRLEVGRLLRWLPRAPASEALTAVLADEARRRDWRIAIEALGALYETDRPADARA